MAQSNNFTARAYKNVLRALDDVHESLIQFIIEKEYMQKDLDATIEMADTKKLYNDHVKKILEQFKVSSDTKKRKRRLAASLRSCVSKGHVKKVVRYARDSLKKNQLSLNAKRITLEKKLSQHIQDYTKRNPIVSYGLQRADHSAQLGKQLHSLRKEKITLAETSQNILKRERLMFQIDMAEMIPHALQNYMLFNEREYPDRNIRRTLFTNPVLIFTKFNQKRQNPPEPIQPSTDQHMSEPIEISQQQQSSDFIADDEMVNDEIVNDENVNDEVPTVDRNAIETSGMTLNKTVEMKVQARGQRSIEVTNKEPPKMVSKAQSFWNRSNAKEGSHMEMRDSEPHKYPKHRAPKPILTQRASLLKVPAVGVGSQKFCKPKVPAEVGSQNSAKVTLPAEVGSQNSVKGRKAKVTFVDPKPSSSSSSFDMDRDMDAFEADEEFSSFKPTDAYKNSNMETFLEDENDIPMNVDRKEYNFIDDENTDEQDVFGKANRPLVEDEDNNIDDDQISNWTSLEVSSGNRADNNKQAKSPPSKASSIDFHYTPMDSEFPNNSDNSDKSTDNDGFFSTMQGLDKDIGNFF